MVCVEGGCGGDSGGAGVHDTRGVRAAAPAGGGGLRRRRQDGVARVAGTEQRRGACGRGSSLEEELGEAGGNLGGRGGAVAYLRSAAGSRAGAW